MRTAVVSLLIFCVVSRCSTPGQPRPLDSEAAAVALFVDLHRTYARHELSLSAPGRDEVLARHGLDSTAFEAIMDFYARHPDRYVALYAKVADSLGARDMRHFR